MSRPDLLLTARLAVIVSVKALVLSTRMPVPRILRALMLRTAAGVGRERDVLSDTVRHVQSADSITYGEIGLTDECAVEEGSIAGAWRTPPRAPVTEDYSISALKPPSRKSQRHLLAARERSAAAMLPPQPGTNQTVNCAADIS